MDPIDQDFVQKVESFRMLSIELRFSGKLRYLSQESRIMKWLEDDKGHKEVSNFANIRINYVINTSQT